MTFCLWHCFILFWFQDIQSCLAVSFSWKGTSDSIVRAVWGGPLNFLSISVPTSQWHVLLLFCRSLPPTPKYCTQCSVFLLYWILYLLFNVPTVHCSVHPLYNVYYQYIIYSISNVSWSKSWCPCRSVPVHGSPRCLVCFCQLIITPVSTLLSMFPFSGYVLKLRSLKLYTGWLF